MNYEIEQVLRLHRHAGLPVRETVPAPGPDLSAEMIKSRRALRTMTDGLINDGLLSGNVVHVAQGVAAVMVAATGPLVALSSPPGIETFVTAAKELLEDSRTVIDRGMQFQEWDQVQCGAVMLAVVCMGIAAATSIPYHDVLKEMIDAQIEGRKDNVHEILIKAGVVVAPTANDDEGREP